VNGTSLKQTEKLQAQADGSCLVVGSDNVIRCDGTIVTTKSTATIGTWTPNGHGGFTASGNGTVDCEPGGGSTPGTSGSGGATLDGG
jgi:hypothetical protein